MNRLAYQRLVQAIRTQSLLAIEDAITELRAHALIQPKAATVQDRSASELDWELVNARSEDDLTPIASLCHLYAMKSVKGDRDSCDRLDAIASWLVELGADPFSEQARPKRVSLQGKTVYGRGRTLVEVFGQAHLPPSVRARIQAHNEPWFVAARVMDCRMSHAA